MSRKSVVRCLLVAALFVALWSPAAPILADTGEAQTEADTSGLVEGVLDWLVGLVESANGDPDEGDTGPRVDPAG